MPLRGPPSATPATSSTRSATSTASPTTSAWRRSWRSAGAKHFGDQGHGRAVQALRRPRPGAGAAPGGRPCRSTSTLTTAPGGPGGVVPAGRRGGRGPSSIAPMAPLAGSDQPAELAGPSSRACDSRGATRACQPTPCRTWPTTGRTSDAITCPFETGQIAPTVRRLPQRDARGAVHETCSSRRRRSAWIRAGMKSVASTREVNKLFGDNREG